MIEEIIAFNVDTGAVKSVVLKLEEVGSFYKREYRPVRSLFRI